MPSPEFKSWWANFAVTGDICPIRLGATRDEIRSILGDPDDTGGTSGKQLPMIWKYDELEFHFGKRSGDGLFLIYKDTDDGIVQVCIQQHRV